MASRWHEPGCLRFDVVACADDPDRFVLYECYRDSAALAAHRQSPHYRRWRQAAEGVLDPAGGQLIQAGTVLDPPTDPTDPIAPAPPVDPGTPLIIRRAALHALDRGGGVHTLPYLGRWNSLAATLTTGETVFVPGSGLPLHHHNVPEQVLILEGDAAAELEGRWTALGVGDAVWTPAGVAHRFVNRSPRTLRIHWVYAGARVTRTLIAAGLTVDHLSHRDRLGGPAGAPPGAGDDADPIKSP